MITRRTVAGLVLFSFGARAAASPATTVSPEEVGTALGARINAGHGVGMVVGLVTPQERRVISRGSRTAGQPSEIDGNTEFEIGSITKLFTGLLLEDMVRRGEVMLDEPIDNLLPTGRHAPKWGEQPITLLDLATHTSGLPRMPENFAPKDWGNPYADYTPERMLAFLETYKLQRPVGASYEYSNLGVGLLGWALARCAGTDYETLIQERFLRPLNMRDTSVSLRPDQRQRLARGYDQKLAPAENWDLGAFVAAGGLRSTANDMMTFLRAAMLASPIRPLVEAQLSVRRSKPQPGRQVAVTWHIEHLPGGEAIWHDGGTGGYRSFVGFNPATSLGVVVLSNVADDLGVIDIGYHTLCGAPLATV